MNKNLYLIIGLCLPAMASAEIYKSIDADGHVTYSNVPAKGAVKLDIDAGTGAPSQTPKTKSSPAPANFPKVGKVEQKQRDDKRRQILEDELATERQALDDAKKALEEGQSNPEVFHTQVNGKTVTRRNVAKYQEKVGKLQDDVEQHEKNIELLEKELSSMK
jgi:hypothetical protein